MRHGKYTKYVENSIRKQHCVNYSGNTTNMAYSFSLCGFINSKECLKVGCPNRSCIDKSSSSNEFSGCLTFMDTQPKCVDEITFQNIARLTSTLQG